METLKFKTNINCGGCIARVTPFLNGDKHIKSWEVNTETPDKILTVEVEGLSAQDVADVVKKVGFSAEVIPG